MLKLLQVEGHSMAPNAQNGDFILVFTFFNMFKLQPGEWLVFDHPSFGLLLKECVTVDINENSFRCKSINPHGLTEKEIGDINFSRLKGKVFWHAPCQMS